MLLKLNNGFSLKLAIYIKTSWNGVLEELDLSFTEEKGGILSKSSLELPDLVF